MRELVSNWIVALLSAGGAAFVLAAAKAWQVLRSGARSRERDAWDDLIEHNDRLDRRAQLAERDRDYLRMQLARARWQLVTAGMEPEPREIVLPSERVQPAPVRGDVARHGRRGGRRERTAGNGAESHADGRAPGTNEGT